MVDFSVTRLEPRDQQEKASRCCFMRTVYQLRFCEPYMVGVQRCVVAWAFDLI
jgi:hypothetical protein